MIEYADVVIDLAAGDSGKGCVSSDLIKKGNYTHTVRFSGGNNCGHTIFHEGKKIVTHSIPTGVVHGLKSIIGPGCVVNVKHFFEELKELQDSGIKTDGLVFIARNAHVITSEHISEDEKDTKIGTTKKGNGPAYRDKYDRKGIQAFKVKEFEPFLIDIHDEFYKPNDKCRILFEGAQGFQLDIDWGDYPYVTSSHCTPGSAVMNGVPAQNIRKIYGIAKVYETYVGAKKFEPDEEVFKEIRKLGQEYGATTGRPRQCNWMNVNQLVKAVQITGTTDLIIKKTDIFQQLGQWKLIYNGNVLDLGDEHNFIECIKEEIENKCHLIENIIFSYSALGI